MVIQAGSMLVRGVFKAGSLLTGLSNTKSKFKGAEMAGKSTSTEMKRMTGYSHQLRKALALIGVAGFTSLLMQTPQLAGALMKIKTEMMLIAYSIGKHLKPTLDSVATILHGIRTGDWSVIKQGIMDLTKSIVDLAVKAGSVMLKIAFGEESAAQVKTDFDNWVTSLKDAWLDGDFWKFLSTLILDPIKYAMKQAENLGRNLASDIGADKLKQQGLIGWGLGTARDIFSMRSEREQMSRGEYGPTGIASTWGSNKEQSIENQTNTINIDGSNMTGDFNDPVAQNRWFDIMSRLFAEKQQYRTV